MNSEDLEGDLQDLEAKENELDNLIEQAGALLVLFYLQSIKNKLHRSSTMGIVCEQW